MENASIHPNMRDAFRCFSRNGRWGTCALCPKDADGHVYPEACAHTRRYDHLLDVDGLARMHKLTLSDLQKARCATSS